MHRPRGLHPFLFLACLLDPRTKDTEVVPAEVKERFYGVLKDMVRAQGRTQLERTISNGSRSTTEGNDPPKKRARTEVDSERRRLTSQIDQPTGSRTSTPTQMEVAILRSKAAIGRSSDPLAWWKVMANEIPATAAVARTILSIPATSAPCERIPVF
eukprot:TRINITY_DN8173_c0_g1_i3.p1 TRINITY_DN8173_c0_g1~~TRINITY_DN8173_c0_g1_i3.p1  ORF type:complete len:157 (+),score=20.96 TRINITY_DN8173_c0_g1_i3:159-629(+)